MLLKEEVIVNKMRMAYNGWIDTLTDFEKKAFRKYSFNSFDRKPNRFFERVNTMLRGTYNLPDKPRLKLYADAMSKAIDRMHLPYNIVCYRGVDIDPTDGISVGTEFYIEQFLSTSVVRSRILSGRKYLIVIYAPKGTNGAYIEKISKYPNQREFLLNKHCLYKYVGRTENVIKLEVIV